MIKHLKRFVAITISLVMAFQFSTNDLYTYAQTEDVVEPTQTEVSTESDSTATEQPVKPSETVEGAADTTTPPDTGESAMGDTGNEMTGESQVSASTNDEVKAKALIIEFENIERMDSISIDVSDYYVGSTVNLLDFSELENNLEVDGYTLKSIVTNDETKSVDLLNKDTLNVILTEETTTLKLQYDKNDNDSEEQETDNISEILGASNESKEIPDINANVIFLSQDNSIIYRESRILEGGIISEANPTQEYQEETYLFEQATVDAVKINYIVAREDGIYYSVEGTMEDGVGLKLQDSDSLEVYYKQVGNKVPVSYSLEGEYTVEGNEIIGFPSYAEKGGSFSFQVNTARGYEADVSVNGQTLEADGTTYTVSNVSEDMVIQVNFKKLNSVTFDLGVWNNPDYRYLYDNHNPRFTFINPQGGGKLEGEVGEDGADFDFSFKTNSSTWLLDSFNINGIYLAIPSGGNEGASAKTILYGSGTNSPCEATITINDIDNNGRRT